MVLVLEKQQNTHEQCEHVGAYLRRARGRAGLSLDAVSDALKVRSAYLSAIENLDEKELPSLGYVLGFVRAYAVFLGEDGKDAVRRYKLDVKDPHNTGMRDRPHHIPKHKMRLPKGSAAVTTVLACTLVLASWYGSKSDARSQNIAVQAASAQQNWGFELRRPMTGDPDMVSLRAIATSWVEVLDANGLVLVSRIMVPGEIFETRKQNDLVLSLRDGGAIEIFIGGKSVGLAGEKGKAVQDIKLSEMQSGINMLTLSSAAKAQ